MVVHKSQVVGSKSSALRSTVAAPKASVAKRPAVGQLGQTLQQQTPRKKAPQLRAAPPPEIPDDEEPSPTRDSERAFYHKWKTRAAFDRWHRTFTQRNRAILQRLYQSATYEKGLSVQKRHALATWRAVHSLHKRRQMLRLQAVADVRLSMLLSDTVGATNPLLSTRKLAVSWSRPLVFKCFRAWRRSYAPSH